MSMRMFKRLVLPGICLVLTLNLPGCGSGEEVVVLGLVTGVVTDNGAPVGNAIVEFFPDDGRTSVGTTNAEGVYSLKYSDEDGAVVGACRVQITPGAGTGAASEEQGSDVMAPPMEAPPSIVSLPDKVTVAKGENKLDFEIGALLKASAGTKRRK